MCAYKSQVELNYAWTFLEKESAHDISTMWTPCIAACSTSCTCTCLYKCTMRARQKSVNPALYSDALRHSPRPWCCTPATWLSRPADVWTCAEDPRNGFNTCISKYCNGQASWLLQKTLTASVFIHLCTTEPMYYVLLYCRVWQPTKDPIPMRSKMSKGLSLFLITAPMTVVMQGCLRACMHVYVCLCVTFRRTD